MNFIIKNATVYDEQSVFNKQKVNVYIKNGLIEKISKTFQRKNGYTIIESPNLCVSAGWVDIFSHFNEPGTEQNETIASGAHAAAAGGFSDVFILPNTQPTVSNAAMANNVKHLSQDQCTRIHAIGALSKNTEGKDLAEMYDMHQAGCRIFSDGLKPLQSAGLMLKALQYTNAIQATLVQVPIDESINKHGLMHEGAKSVELGLAGMPDIAEHTLLKRDIDLANYADARIHFTGISSAQSVEILRQAKKTNKKISCSVSPYHLAYTHDHLNSYDSNFKVNPPLRSNEDRLALIEGIKDGTIDCIATHHLPQCWDNKTSEFEYAKFGMIGLQTCFSTLNTLQPKLSLRQIVKLLTHARNLFLSKYKFAENEAACITLFDPSVEWNYTTNNNQSQSANSPLLNTLLKGKVIGIIQQHKAYFNAY